MKEFTSYKDQTQQESKGCSVIDRNCKIVCYDNKLPDDWRMNASKSSAIRFERNLRRVFPRKSSTIEISISYNQDDRNYSDSVCAFVVARHTDETSHYPSILCRCARCARMTLIESDFCYSPLVSNFFFSLSLTRARAFFLLSRFSRLIYQEFLTITNVFVVDFFASLLLLFFRFLNTYDYYQSTGKKNSKYGENQSITPCFSCVFYWKNVRARERESTRALSELNFYLSSAS